MNSKHAAISHQSLTCEVNDYRNALCSLRGRLMFDGCVKVNGENESVRRLTLPFG